MNSIKRRIRLETCGYTTCYFVSNPKFKKADQVLILSWYCAYGKHLKSKSNRHYTRSVTAPKRVTGFISEASAWATQLRKNMAAGASCLRHHVGIDPMTYRTNSGVINS